MLLLRTLEPDSTGEGGASCWYVLVLVLLFLSCSLRLCSSFHVVVAAAPAAPDDDDDDDGGDVNGGGGGGADEDDNDLFRSLGCRARPTAISILYLRGVIMVKILLA